jgi:hypothetical protein
VSDFRGAFLVAILMAAVVALAIVFPYLGERSGPTVIKETSGTDGERNEIRDTVREYLLKHPEVIVEALEAMQNRRQQNDKARKRGALAANRDALLNESRDPFIGNPGAGITLASSSTTSARTVNAWHRSWQPSPMRTRTCASSSRSSRSSANRPH